MVTQLPGTTDTNAARARDDRQEAMDRWRGVGATLVAVSLAVPGPTKVPPGSLELFVWALGELKRALPAARTLYVTRDALGPFALWSTPGDAAIVKRRCMAVEASRPAARLLDIDVYSPEGMPIDRQTLQLPPRTCLCCGDPARDCIRVARHEAEVVVARAGDLLATFGA
jgi:holo-ACP synthase CitX